MIKVAIVGATGYSGLELLRLLEHHPNVKVCKVISGSHSGQSLASIFPHLNGIIEDSLTEFNSQQLAKEVDIVFFATPAGVSTSYIPDLIDLGVACIDLSGDFRLKDPQDYDQWYKFSSAGIDYLEQAAYGLTEIFPEEIKQAKLIANPGCYPTATLLGLIPGLKLGLIDPNSIMIDGKSGISGAGRGLSLNTHFSEINENIKAYKLGTHQHIPEIEQVLGKVLGEEPMISLATHLIPLTRGMMCSIYGKLEQNIAAEEIVAQYQTFYQDHPFVRVRNVPDLPSVKDVVGSNYCDIGIAVDERTQRITIISVIDNLVKGAAGQGIQNMNLIQGLAQTTGLTFVPVYP